MTECKVLQSYNLDMVQGYEDPQPFEGWSVCAHESGTGRTNKDGLCEMIPTGRQIREARALLGLTRNALATKVRTVTTATITRAELVDGEPSITVAQATAIRSFFEGAGIEFVAEGDEEVCVQLRKVDQKDSEP